MKELLKGKGTIKNQKIIIVGGSTGIGYAVAQKSLAAGAHVVIGSRSLEKLQKAVLSIGQPIQIEVIDVSDESSIIDFFKRTGSFDHLVVTVKPQLPSGPFISNDFSMIKSAFDTKVWGQYLLAKHAVPYLLPGGSMVLTSGVASQRSYPGYSVVSMMNSATESLTKALAVELAPIRVNAVCPGFVDTIPPTPGRSQHVQLLVPNLPMNRLAGADEVAQAYLYFFRTATQQAVFLWWMAELLVKKGYLLNSFFVENRYVSVFQYVGSLCSRKTLPGQSSRQVVGF